MSYSFKRLGFEGVDIFLCPLYYWLPNRGHTKNSTTLTQHTDSNRLNFLRDFEIIDSLIVLKQKGSPILCICWKYQLHSREYLYLFKFR